MSRINVAELLASVEDTNSYWRSSIELFAPGAHVGDPFVQIYVDGRAAIAAARDNPGLLERVRLSGDTLFVRFVRNGAELSVAGKID